MQGVAALQAYLSYDTLLCLAGEMVDCAKQCIVHWPSCEMIYNKHDGRQTTRYKNSSCEPGNILKYP